MSDLPDYVQRNRAHWDATADEWVKHGEANWSGEEVWGIWGLPEHELRLLPADLTDRTTIELGCGTGYVSAWLIRRGARATGIDNSAAQLATARRLAARHGVELELIHGNAERVPKPDAWFDFAITEYGAAIWADPYQWVPEAHRLLKPGGELVMLGHHPLTICVSVPNQDVPLTRTLQQPYFGMHRVDWDLPGEESTEFNLPVSEWFRLFRETGFQVLDYQELRAPSPAAETRFFATADWAYDFPSEQVWKLRKRAG